MAGQWLTPNEAADTSRLICIAVPDDEYLFACLLGAVLALTKEDSWEQAGEMTPAEVAALFVVTFDGLASNA